MFFLLQSRRVDLCSLICCFFFQCNCTFWCFFCQVGTSIQTFTQLFFLFHSLFLRLRLLRSFCCVLLVRKHFWVSIVLLHTNSASYPSINWFSFSVSTYLTYTGQHIWSSYNTPLTWAIFVYNSCCNLFPCFLIKFNVSKYFFKTKSLSLHKQSNSIESCVHAIFSIVDLICQKKLYSLWRWCRCISDWSYKWIW